MSSINTPWVCKFSKKERVLIIIGTRKKFYYYSEVLNVQLNAGLFTWAIVCLFSFFSRFGYTISPIDTALFRILALWPFKTILNLSSVFVNYSCNIATEFFLMSQYQVYCDIFSIGQIITIINKYMSIKKLILIDDRCPKK